MTTDPIPLSLSWSSKCFKTHFYWISGQTSSIFHSKWDQYCWDCLIRQPKAQCPTKHKLA